MQSNSETNTLLLLILAVLLFGSGAVLGFFSTVFWIIVAIVIVIGLIWFLVSLPRVVKGEVEESKNAFKKHPVYGTIFWSICIIFFLWWSIAYLTQRGSSQKASNSTTNLAPLTTTSKQQIQPQTKASDYQSQKGYKFPAANRTAFTQNCIKEAGAELAGISQSYCSCMLNYIELNYSFKEFLNIEQIYVKTQKFPPDIVAAMSKCVK